MGIASEADLAAARLRIDELEKADPKSNEAMERTDLLDQVKAFLAKPIKGDTAGPANRKD